jgi:TPR repeat protein
MSLKAADDQGDAAAQLSIGICLWYGKGILRDPSAAAKYVERSSTQGNSKATMNYAYCLRKGEGIAQDLT